MSKIIALAYFITVDESNIKDIEKQYNAYADRYDDVADLDDFLVKVVSTHVQETFDYIIEQGIAFRAEGQRKFINLDVDAIQRFAKSVKQGESIKFDPTVKA